MACALDLSWQQKQSHTNLFTPLNITGLSLFSSRFASRSYSLSTLDLGNLSLSPPRPDSDSKFLNSFNSKFIKLHCPCERRLTSLLLNLRESAALQALNHQPGNSSVKTPSELVATRPSCAPHLYFLIFLSDDMERSNIHLTSEKVKLSVRVLPPKNELQHSQDPAVEHALHRERRFLSIASTDINLAKLTSLLEVEWKEKYIPQAHHNEFYIDRLRDRYENDLDPDYRLEETLFGYPEPHIIKIVIGHIDRESSIPICSKFRNFGRNEFRSPIEDYSVVSHTSTPVVEIGADDLHGFPCSSPKRKRGSNELFDTPRDSQSHRNVKVESGTATYSKRIGRNGASDDQFDVNNTLRENADLSYSRKRMRRAHSNTCTNYPEHLSIQPRSPTNIKLITNEKRTTAEPVTEVELPRLATPPLFNSYKAAKKRKHGSDASSPLEQRSKRQKNHQDGSSGRQHRSADTQNDTKFFSKRSTPAKIRFKIEPQAGVETLSSSPEILHSGPAPGKIPTDPIDLTSPPPSVPRGREHNAPSLTPLPSRAAAATLSSLASSPPAQPVSRAKGRLSRPISVSPKPIAEGIRPAGGASPVLDSSPPPQHTPRVRSGTTTAAATATATPPTTTKKAASAVPEAKARSMPVLKWGKGQNSQAARHPPPAPPPVVKKQESSSPDWPPRSQRELLAALSSDESSSDYGESDDL